MRALADKAAGRAGSGRWGDLRKRTLSAALLAPVALLCIWLGAGGWTIMMAAAAVLLGFEWVALCNERALALPGCTVPLVLIGAGLAAVLGFEISALAVLAMGTVLVRSLSGRWRLAAGIPYLGVPLVALVWLRGSDAVGRYDVLFVVFVVWASDIGAYAVGRLAGGPKLAPSISPGKTWSGAVGGLVIAMAVGEIAAQAMVPGPTWRAAGVAGLLGVASVCGDLLESWIKRRFGVKDSGTLIPGHGGLLDRLDGLLAAAPTAALLALVLGRGGVLWQ